MAGPCRGRNNLIDYPWAKAYMPGGEREHEFAGWNEFIRTHGQNEDYFVALSTPGAHEFCKVPGHANDNQYYEIWHLLNPGGLIPFAQRYHSLADPVTLHPRPIDERVVDLIVGFDSVRTSKQDLAVRRAVAMEVINQAKGKDKEIRQENLRRAAHDLLKKVGFGPSSRVSVPVQLEASPAPPEKSEVLPVIRPQAARAAIEAIDAPEPSVEPAPVVVEVPKDGVAVEKQPDGGAVVSEPGGKKRVYKRQNLGTSKTHGDGRVKFNLSPEDQARLDAACAVPPECTGNI